MRIFYYMRKFWEIPKIEKILFLKACFLFFIGSLIIKIVPLKYYLFLMQCNKDLSKADKTNNYLKRVISITTQRVSRILPFKISCLERVFILALLSKNLDIGYQIRFYLMKNNENNLTAHSEIFFYKNLYEKSNTQSIVIC